MKTETDNSIYLEPGSVWRCGDEWRRVIKTENAFNEPINSTDICYEIFGWSHNRVSFLVDWLSWAKHTDTVLVYSPSGNKLPPKPGYVRVKIPVIVDQDGHAWHNPDGGDHDSIVDVFGFDGTRLYVTFDARFPTATVPDEVEGVTE